MSKTPILFQDVKIFNGQDDHLSKGMRVLVEGQRITKINHNIPAPTGAQIINAGGRVLMPGLSDAHWHSMFCFWPISKVLSSDFGHLSIAAAKAARETLMRGFTTVRDVGGNSFPLAHATDEGLIEGPRIYPSGGYISQTSGHGDFRGPLEVPTNSNAPLDYLSRVGHTLLADGVPEVIKRTREVLRMGATQIKAMAGGGVSSLYDSLDVTQYTFQEMKAICDVARTWNTYVTIHVNTDAAIRQALEAGVTCFEHGFFLQEETAKLMAEKDVWWSMQPLMNDEDAIQFEDPRSTAKFEACTAGLDQAVKFAKKYQVKTAFGTDSLFDPETSSKQGKLLAKLERWYTPYEALKMATYDNAQLFKMCGPRDPYPGEFGVVKEGAFADLLVVDGDPLKDLELVANPEKNFLVIMKDGQVYKNMLR